MTEKLSREIKTLGFFLIIMVLYIHADNSMVRFSSRDVDHGPSPAHNIMVAFISGGICGVAVPLFFAVSGYLFFYNLVPSLDAYRDKFKRRVFSLVIPYVAWSMLGLAIFFVLQSIPFSKAFFTRSFVREMSFRQIMDAVFIHPMPYQLWFLRNLIIYTIFTPVIYWALKRISAFPMLLIMTAFLVSGNKLRGDAFYYIHYFFYYLCGCFIAIKRIDLSKRPSGAAPAAVLAAWAALLVADVCFIAFRGHSVFALNAASVVIGGIALWWNYDLLFAWIEKRRFFWITSFTFFIYAAHEPLMTIYKKTLTYYLRDRAYVDVLVYLLVPVLTIGTVLAAGRVFKASFGNLYNLFVGGRG